MGGCFQTRWSRKAKKRRLLLTRDLRLLQLGVGAYWILSRLGIIARRSSSTEVRLRSLSCLKFTSLLRRFVVALM